MDNAAWKEDNNRITKHTRQEYFKVVGHVIMNYIKCVRKY